MAFGAMRTGKSQSGPALRWNGGTTYRFAWRNRFSCLSEPVNTPNVIVLRACHPQNFRNCLTMTGLRWANDEFAFRFFADFWFNCVGYGSRAAEYQRRG